MIRFWYAIIAYQNLKIIGSCSMKNTKSILLFMVMILLSVSSSAQAKVTAVVERDSLTGKLCEYPFDALRDQILKHVIGIQAPLYDEYVSGTKKVQAFRDSDKGYVKADVVFNAVLMSSIQKLPFDLDDFLSKVNDDASMFNTVEDIQERIMQNENVINGRINPGNEKNQQFDVIDIQ